MSGNSRRRLSGRRFVPNVPTEEVFTTPDWRRAEGTVRSYDAAAGSLTSAGVSNDALKQLRDELKSQKDLVIIFGSELQGADIGALVKFGSASGAKFICLGDYANSRGAADMGLYPDLLPGYVAINGPHSYNEEWGSLSKTKGMSLPEMMHAAKAGKLSALYVVGSNPWSLQLRSRGAAKHVRGRAGHVPHRNCDARRRRPSSR